MGELIVLFYIFTKMSHRLVRTPVSSGNPFFRAVSEKMGLCYLLHTPLDAGFTEKNALIALIKHLILQRLSRVLRFKYLRCLDRIFDRLEFALPVQMDTISDFLVVKI